MPADGEQTGAGPAVNPMAKRRYPRFNKAVPFKYRIVSMGGLLLRARTVDISGGGLCLRTNSEIPKGAVIAMEVDIGEAESLIQAVGRIVWVRKTENDMLDHGVEFLWTGQRPRDPVHVESLDDVTARLEKMAQASIFDD